MRVAVESLKESVSVSNRFFTYVGMIAIFVSLFIVYFISNRYTKPILRLADLSKEMSELNFSVKYQEKRNDEIDVLGNSMNEMSSKLEQTINELKEANEQLQKDIELKNEIDEMRKEFISNVSHELKTPIALIQGYAEGLNEGINDDPEGSQFYCDVIIDEANKMNKLVKKLLALTQIEFGNSQVNMEKFDLVSVISGVLNSTKILMEEKNINLEFDDSKVWNIYADEFQTEEVITNFVSNAINHSFTENDKNKTIRISVESMEEYVRFKVFNTGKHIPENDLENVWVKFFKVDKARTREYGGSGIGLSIVKAIADSMKVKCGVNNVDGGVEFWFDFIPAEKQKELTEWF
jgi:signal transduction histidine kinase